MVVSLTIFARYHVMRDLRPYVCTARDCDHSNESFASVVEYVYHEEEIHGLKRRRGESFVCIFCGERTEAGKGDNSRRWHVGRHMEEIAFTVVPKAYEEWEFYSESSSTSSYSYEQAKAAVPKRNAAAASADEKWARIAATPSREATAEDAKNHGIPAGHSLKHWDPEKRPLILLDSVFDANSIGKRIYDWTVVRDGAETPMCYLATDLWLLLIKLDGRMTRIESTLLRSMTFDDNTILYYLLDSADRLWQKLGTLLITTEIRKCYFARKNGKKQLGEESGREFIDMLFGRDRQLETTEALMQRIRLWVMRCDANCEDILEAATRA